MGNQKNVRRKKVKETGEEKLLIKMVRRRLKAKVKVNPGSVNIVRLGRKLLMPNGENLNPMKKSCKGKTGKHEEEDKVTEQAVAMEIQQTAGDVGKREDANVGEMVKKQLEGEFKESTASTLMLINVSDIRSEGSGVKTQSFTLQDVTPSNVQLGAQLKEQISEREVKERSLLNQIDSLSKENTRLLKKDIQSKNLRDKIREELNCSVCQKVSRSYPITACQEGHIMCDYCNKRCPGKRCPVCRDPGPRRTSLIARNLIGLLPFNCKYKGCNSVLLGSDMDLHEVVCSQRSWKCPSGPSCIEVVTIGSSKEHLNNICKEAKPAEPHCGENKVAVNLEIQLAAKSFDVKSKAVSFQWLEQTWVVRPIKKEGSLLVNLILVCISI